ncbi:MAG TPA: type IX secretion system membrane protein PorP/SprF [Chitinophagaceae bacterium]|nr:type IX secretion system membrane protein PorP/SprF [Chitinophagaceae bacterium]
MKRLLIISNLFVVGFTATAQQRPHYTQYILNNFILNPALSGIENYTDIKISARNQWVGLNGAPRTAYFTIHGPMGKKDYRTSATSFNVPGENPRGQAYWESYTAAEPHHGIGFGMINDKTGSFSRFSAFASYAYHIGINSNTNFAAGFSGGITVVSLDKSKTDFGGGNPSDPAVGAAVSGELNKLRPDIGAGIWLYSKAYFIGLGAQQIIPQKVAFADDASIITKGRLIPHLFLTAGMRFLIGDDVNAVPSVMIKYINHSSNNNFQPEVNLKLQYRDLFWVGGSYRYEDGYAAMAGINVGNTFNIGYAYDFTTSNLKTVSRGTNEFIIGFLLGNKFADKCPRANW